MDVAKQFLDSYILIHLQNNFDKINLLQFMTKKLALLATKKILPENLDSLSMQEILTSGYLYGLYFREKLEEIFEFMKAKINKEFSDS